jgi:hypothetical protein
MSVITCFAKKQRFPDSPHWDDIDTLAAWPKAAGVWGLQKSSGTRNPRHGRLSSFSAIVIKAQVGQ